MDLGPVFGSRLRKEAEIIPANLIHTKRVASILRWAGSKRKLLPVLLSVAPPEYSRYIEPFAGSACLFFALEPANALLGDINPELLHAYRMLRRNPEVLYRTTAAMPITKQFYYQLRTIDPKSLSAEKRAARFIYLNRHCFNGVYRTNAAGQFNVPRGTRTGHLPTKAEFLRAGTALKRATLRLADFGECLADVQKGDFVYLDPPYASRSGRWRGEYGPTSFRPADVDRLLKHLEEIDNRGAIFVLSYAKCREIGNIVRRWHSISVHVQRHVAGFSAHRHKVTEILVSNAPM